MSQDDLGVILVFSAVGVVSLVTGDSTGTTVIGVVCIIIAAMMVGIAIGKDKK